FGFSVPCAQESQDRSGQLREESITDNERQLTANINFCRQLIRERNYEGAAALLELLYESSPENVVIISLLVQCYNQLQHYEKSQAVITRHLDRYPGHFNFRLLLAEVFCRQGKRDEARQTYYRAAASLPPENDGGLEAVVQSMVMHELDDAAENLIDSLRLQLADSTRFAIQKGMILQRHKRYAEAAREYYLLLPDTSGTGSAAEKRIVALLDFIEAAGQAEQAMLGQPDLFDNSRALKILSAYYLKSGQLDRAFQFAVHQDSLEGFRGSTPLAYMKSSFERKLYGETVRMGDYLTARGGELSKSAEPHFIYAEALVELGRHGDAIRAYSSIHDTFSRNRERARALIGIGSVYLDRLSEYDTALVYFDSVKTYYTHDRIFLTAMMAIPFCHLRRGDLPAAAGEFEGLLQRRLDSEQQETVAYYLALIRLIDGQTDSAAAALNKLLVDFPRGFYVNDAVRLLVTIDEARQYPTVLRAYSDALLFEERRMPDSSSSRLNTIWQSGAGVLADLALYKLAVIGLAEGDSASAAGYLDSLLSQHPDSYYVPYALKTKADLLSADMGTLDEAKEILRRLLEDYPNYPFISEARKKLRRLEETSGSA
ncbi:MAG: tetratricopeptide repeat protein, partial [Candidatus Zixiibacteriota bacterium]